MSTNTLTEQKAQNRRLGIILATCCLSLFVVGVDVTIVNIALPSIQRSFGASTAGLQWTIDAYTVVLASLLMLSGSLADRLGRRRVFQAGLALFTLGSLLCSLAPGLGWLIAFRMIQAVGGSMLNPVALAIIANTFTDPAKRARAMGVWGSVFGISLAVGPVLGGVLVGTVGWRAIFWVNVPVGLAAIALTQRFVPESRAPRPRRLDPIAQILIVVLLAGLTAGTIEGPQQGWTSPLIVTCYAAAVVAAVAVTMVEWRRREPLIDPRFFASAPFSGAALLAVAAFAALAGFLFLNTLYLQTARGYSAIEAGLLILPMAATNALTARLSGRLVAAGRSRWALLIAGVAITAGSAVLITVGATAPVAELIVIYIVFGIGFGFVNPPISNTAVSGMPPAQAGVAASIASTCRQVGATLGVAVIGSMIAGHATAGFITASHGGWAVVCGCGLAVLLIGLASTSGWARATARRTRELLITEPEEGALRDRDSAPVR
ncbi:MAG TPA: MFS transporter [Trebonia sp.]|jgi:EmrB/QacA subfamily drug resistance transporter|nr:MFS transporter [Trebonia sp.]